VRISRISFNATTDQLSPRVEDELITIPFKQYFEKAFSKKTADAFRADPMKLVEWIKKNIRLNPDKKALRIAQTPVGVMKSKITDERSRDIFFVDVARSLGIEAQKDAVTGKIQYKKNGEWQDVKFDNTAEKTSTAAALGTIKLTYEPTKLLDNPKYYSHFTISRIENGTAHLLNFEEGQADMGNGTTWSNTFKKGYKLDAGTYMLTTGTRLASGSVLASNRLFEIVEGQTTTLPLVISQHHIHTPAHQFTRNPFRVFRNHLGFHVGHGLSARSVQDLIPAAVTDKRRTSGTVVTYEVVISAPNPDLKLKPRLTANVTIYTLDRKNVLSVPARALRFTPEKPLIGENDIVKDCESEHKLWTREGNTFIAHPVTVGISNGVNTEIVSGIDEGATVVTEATIGRMPGEGPTADMPQEPSGEKSPFMPGPPGSKKKNNSR
jgi:hypothetical protein